MKKLNKWFFTGLIVIALLPILPGIILALGAMSPILIVLIFFGVAYKFWPGFAPIRWLADFLSGIVSGIARGISFLFGAVPFPSFGSARFMNGFDRWGLIGRSQKGLLIDGNKYRLSEKASFESVLTVGGMGRGKTSIFLIPNLLTAADASYVVTDTSGEIYERTSGYLASKGYQIKVLNLMDMNRSDQYNPLVQARSYTDLSLLAGTLIRSAYPNSGSDQQFWNAGAEKLTRVFINCLSNHGNPYYQNLANIRHLIANFDTHHSPPGQLGRMDQFVLQNTQSDPSTFADYQAIANGNPKTIASILTTADVALSPLGDPALANLLSANTIDFSDLRQRKTIIYVMVRQQQLTHYQFLLNLFYTDLINSLLGSLANTDRPVYLLLDEFGHLQIPQFDVFSTTARKYRVGFWIFLQSLAQLEARYGRDRAKITLDGLQTEIYLPGSNLTTARSIEQRLGTLMSAHSKAAKPLMNADQIIRMKDNQALLLHSNKRPMLMKTRPYFRNRGLRSRASRNPKQLPSVQINSCSLIQI